MAKFKRKGYKQFDQNLRNYPDTATFPVNPPSFSMDGVTRYVKSNGLVSTAQATGNSVITTAPSFYSPYHTPSAWQIPTNRKEVYAWCLHPDTLITMFDFTQKPISEIKQGDKVLTGSGTEGTVKYVNKKQFSGYLKKIQTIGSVDYIKATPEHKFYYAPEDEFSCKYFKSTFRFCREKYACSSKKCDDHTTLEDRIEIKDCHAGELEEGDFLYSPTNVLKGTREDFSPEFMRFLGYYLAEGSVIFRNNQPSYLTFSFGESEKETLVKDCCEIIKKEFNYDAKVINKPSVLCVEIYSKELASKILDLCGRYSYEKVLSEIILNQNKELLKQLIIGYYLGDGHSVNKEFRGKGEIKLTSINYNLLSQIRFILFGLGIPSRQGNDTKDQKEEGKYYSLWVDKLNSNLIKEWSPIENYKTEQIEILKFNTQFFQTENKVFSRIKDISEEWYEGLVYDFHVDDETNCHQYLANFSTVSNSSYWFENEPIVATGIDFYAYFSMNGFDLECSDGEIKEVFEKECSKLELNKWLTKIAHEYFLFGDVFIFLELQCEQCSGTGIDKKTGAACNHYGATWGGLNILDPNTVEVSPSFLGGDPEIQWVPPDQLIEVCIKGKPESIYQNIPPLVREMIKSKQPIKLSNLSTHHLKFGASAYRTYGISLVRRLFPTLAYRDKLRQAQWLTAERHILPVKVVKIGSDNRPANDEDIQNVLEQLSSVQNDPLQTIVTHHSFDYEWIGAAGKVLQLTNEYELINEDLQTGLQLNKSLLHGEGPNYASAQVGLDALAAKLNTFRNEIAEFIEQKIFKPIAEFNNLTTTDPRGATTLIYPKVKFHDLALKDDNARISNMMVCRARGEISLRTLLTELGLDYDVEVEQIRQEEATSMMLSPDLGLGVSEGEDLGGGGAGGMSQMGIPPEEGADLGGGLGGGQASGVPMPPTGGPGGGEMGMGTPLAASFMKQNYKYAVNKLNEKLAEYNKNNHENEIFGNSFRGKMPEESNLNYFDLDQEDLPLSNGLSMNRFLTTASQECLEYLDDEFKERLLLFKQSAKKQDNTKKTFFTRIEEQLYKGIAELQLEVPFFAQYLVGGNPKYRVDGSFPTIKVAVEADGETWHSDPEKIAKDKERDSVLSELGWIVLRFTEKEVEQKLDKVIEVIKEVVNSRYNS